MSHANPYTTTDKILLIAVVARGNWPNPQARDAAQTAVSDRHCGGLRQMRTANLLTAPPSQSAYGWCDSGRTSMADADDVRRTAHALPHVADIDGDGFDFRVADKGFVWS